MNTAADNIIHALGLILSNTAVYGSQHAVTRQAGQSCFRLLQQAWASGDIKINITEQGLSVNHDVVVSRSPLVKHFVEHIEQREITNVILRKVMTEEQFLAFLEVLNAKPEELEQLGGFGGALEAVALSDVVGVRNVVYREVADDQTVVAKKRNATLDEPVDNGRAADGDSDNGAVMREILAFLRGDDNGMKNETAQQIREKGADAAQLADLILTAAETKAFKTPHAADENASDTLVECLHRAYRAMTQDPSFHTQKTKKQIQRTLTLLKSELLQKLQGKDDIAFAACENAIRDAIEGIHDELAIDALAQEYAKKWKAVNSSEKRILRYLKRTPTETIEQSELKQRLMDSGLDDDNWRELLLKSGVSQAELDRQEKQDGISKAVGGVAETLKKLQQDIAQADGAAKLSKQDIRGIQTQIDGVVRQTEKSIQTLIDEIGGKSRDARSQTERPNLTRKRLFEILAEIGQELCQPLSVINCSVDMLRDGSLGDIAEMQKEMLDTAADSGQKIQKLIDKLIAIAGRPKGLAVDKSIQSELYEE